MNNKRSLVVLILIVLVGAVLRLYRIGDYMGFLGDEGRDVLVVKRMLVDHDLTLLGPITSVGLMHLGPAYYYFMTPFLWLTRLDPVGPAIMVALFSLATIWLIWRLASEYFNEKAAAIAAFLYALSPLVIIHSHSSWNPNILPFWGLLFMYSLFKTTIDQKPKWLLVAGLAFGITLQLHYVALVYVPIGIITLLLVGQRPKLKYWLLGVAGWLTTFSPFILFELKHHFINSQTVFSFITRSGNGRTFGVMDVLPMFWDLTVRLFWRLVVVVNAEISIVFLIVILGVVFYLTVQNRRTKFGQSLLLLFIWFGVGLGVLSFYRGLVFDYYLMFAFPLPFILTGIVLSQFRTQAGKIATLLILVGLCWVHFKETPIAKPPNRLVTQTRDIAQFILDQTQRQPYNFALITGQNSDHAYRYFLEILGHPPLIIENPDIDPERKSITQQLFVVCEEKDCHPLGHPLWEVAGFGRAEIEKVWKVGLFQVFKMVHYRGS